MLSSKPPRASSYIDPTQEFTSRELSWSLWYVAHKVILYRIVVGLLITISAGAWGFVCIYMVIYGLVGWQSDQAVQKSLTSFGNSNWIEERYGAQPLQISNPTLIPGAGNTYTTLAQITNPNSRFIAYVDYYAVTGDERTDVQHTVLLPLEVRPLVVGGISGNGTPEIALAQVKWQRVSAHTVSDIPAWQQDRLNFAVENFVFTPPFGKNGADASIITFDLVNQSAYGYANPQFIAGLYRAGDLVDAIPFALPSFRSGERHKIDLRSFATGLAVTDVQVFPLINVYDVDEYLPPGA